MFVSSHCVSRCQSTYLGHLRFCLDTSKIFSPVLISETSCPHLASASCSYRLVSMMAVVRKRLKAQGASADDIMP